MHGRRGHPTSVPVCYGDRGRRLITACMGSMHAQHDCPQTCGHRQHESGGGSMAVRSYMFTTQGIEYGTDPVRGCRLEEEDDSEIRWRSGAAARAAQRPQRVRSVGLCFQITWLRCRAAATVGTGPLMSSKLSSRARQRQFTGGSEVKRALTAAIRTVGRGGPGGTRTWMCFSALSMLVSNRCFALARNLHSAGEIARWVTRPDCALRGNAPDELCTEASHHQR